MKPPPSLLHCRTLAKKLPHSQPQLHITNAHQQRFFLAPPHSQPQLHITNAHQQRFFFLAPPPHSQCGLATTLLVATALNEINRDQ
jgi:hypothetical protein